MNGKNQQIKGKSRELAGKLTLNEGQQIKGKVEQDIGKVREKVQKAKASIWVVRKWRLSYSLNRPFFSPFYICIPPAVDSDCGGHQQSTRVAVIRGSSFFLRARCAKICPLPLKRFFRVLSTSTYEESDSTERG